MKILLKSKAIVSVCVYINFCSKYLFPYSSSLNSGAFSLRLLYAVFVVSNENTTVSELATTLQAELSKLQAAASFVCRLGWATKVIDPESILGDSNIAASPRSTVSDEDASITSQGSENMLIDNDSIQQGDASGSGNNGSRSTYTRVAFIVDANITSYLMMGSVSPGLTPED